MDNNMMISCTVVERNDTLPDDIVIAEEEDLNTIDFDCVDYYGDYSLDIKYRSIDISANSFDCISINQDCGPVVSCYYNNSFFTTKPSTTATIDTFNFCVNQCDNYVIMDHHSKINNHPQKISSCPLFNKTIVSNKYIVLASSKSEQQAVTSVIDCLKYCEQDGFDFSFLSNDFMVSLICLYVCLYRYNN